MISNIEERKAESKQFSGENDVYIHIEVKDGKLESITASTPFQLASVLGVVLRCIADNVAKEKGIDNKEVQKRLVVIFSDAFVNNPIETIRTFDIE